MATKPKMPPVEQLRGRQLGRILIKMGRIRRAEVDEALQVQKQRRGPIGQILVELGHITEEDLNLALAAQVGMEYVDLSTMEIGDEVIQMVPAQMVNTYQICPFDYDPGLNTVSIALSSPDNFQATDDLKTLLGLSVKAAITTVDSMRAAIARYYPEEGGESIEALIDEITTDDTLAQFEGRGGEYRPGRTQGKWPRLIPSRSCSTWCCSRPFEIRPVTSTSSRSRTSSRCVIVSTVSSTK